VGEIPSPTSGASVVQSEVLEDLSQAVNYRRWLCRLALPWLGSDPIEVGSGIGDYAAEWAASVPRITASEADPGRLERLRARFGDADNVTVRALTVPLTDRASHSALVAYNVLEHIEDDVAALRSFRGLLRPEGVVVLLVPAFEFAMSPFDRLIGHHRRYTRASLASALGAAGYVPHVCRYVNPLGLLAWVVMMRGLRRRPRAGLALRAYDAIVPGLERLERLGDPPFGQSVFAVAKALDG
jgi:SAM-dependent methyltransferase